jgi:hypothetical protein
METNQRGYSAVEFLGLIAVIGIALVGMTALRPKVVSTKAPVDAITPIIRLLGKPLENLEPRPRPSRPRTTKPRPRRPAPRKPPSTVEVPLPDWWR